MTDLEKRIEKLEEGFVNVTRNMVWMKKQIDDSDDFGKGIMATLADTLNRVNALEKSANYMLSRITRNDK